MSLDGIKPGDKLMYVGPPRNPYTTGPLDHPSHYHNYVVEEVHNDFVSRLLPSIKFVRISCSNPQGKLCGGSKVLGPDDWSILQD
jgi:hypothetical protein